MAFLKPIIRSKHIGLIEKNFDYYARQAREENRLVAPVLKSNAYGFGTKKIAETLYRKGARVFFTSDFWEAMEIKSVLSSDDVTIYTLHGFDTSTGIEAGIYPVLNNECELHAYQALLKDNGIPRRPAAIHLNTGMNRDGLDSDSIDKIKAADNIDICFYMTHLCAVELNTASDQKFSKKQISALKKFLDVLPEKPLSITATHGSFYLERSKVLPIRQDIERIGIGLYGDIPGCDLALSMSAKILSVRKVRIGETIGYDCAYTAKRDMKIATIAIGYGDGYPREASVKDGQEPERRAYMTLNGYKAPVVGVVSMNLTCVDVTDIPDDMLSKESYIEVIGKNTPIQHLAKCTRTCLEDVMISLSRPNIRATDHFINEEIL